MKPLLLAAFLVLVAEESTAPEIRRADLERHVRYLASDELAGRKTGTAECREAARYLEAELERFGLEPAGDDGGFLQLVPFQREAYSALPELEVAGEAGVFGRDFIARQGGPSGTFQVHLVQDEGDIPAQADRGLALFFPATRRARARTWLKRAGHRLGAGFGMILTPLREAGQEITELPRPGRMHLAPEEPVERTPWLEVGADFAERLEEGSELRAELHFGLEPMDAFNVLGRLKGAGGEGRPDLARECVVLSAHYDHLGLDERHLDDPAADTVYNGADDDASGVATVLELAEALAAASPPAREVLVLLATAEEIGIVGTSYYLDHPSTPLERTVCNLNFEMVGRPDDLAGGPGKLWLTGGELTNLMEGFDEAGIAISADPYPEQRFFSRSDNIVFVQRGIVAQTFSSYDLHEDYHHVSDEVETLDFDHMQTATRAAYRAVRLVVDGELDPAWLPGKQPKPRR